MVDREDKELLLGQTGSILWFTGAIRDMGGAPPIGSCQLGRALPTTCKGARRLAAAVESGGHSTLRLQRAQSAARLQPHPRATLSTWLSLFPVWLIYWHAHLRCARCAGLSGSGKSAIARSLERTLHANGHLTMLLDGDSVRRGLCQDLGSGCGGIA